MLKPKACAARGKNPLPVAAHARPDGFRHECDILEITVNRWSHGCSCFVNSLFDDEAESEKTMLLARRRHGRVTIANSDAGWDAYMHTAIEEASRAVKELPG